MRTLIFYFTKRVWALLKIYESQPKRKIYKWFFKMVQRRTGRMKKSLKDSVGGLVGKIDQSEELGQSLSNIRQRGYCLIPPSDSFDFFPHHQEVVTRAKNLLYLSCKSIEPSPTKGYLHRLNNIPEDDLSAFYSYFTNPVYLEFAAGYLQDEPLLTELKLLVSPVSSGKHAELEGSQLWHSDFDDEANLKVFIFLDDIDEYSGPLQAVSRSKSKDYMNAWNYQWGKKGVSHNDLIVPETESSSIETFIGEAATVCLIDTVACLHRGSRFPTRERRILYANYNTRTSYRFPPLNWIALAPKTNVLSSPLLHLDPALRFIDRSALNN